MGSEMQKTFIQLLLTLLFIVGLSSIIFAQTDVGVTELANQLKLDIPKKGFISPQKATRWEESLLSGNGTIGALIRGNPGNDVIILSHEKLFMPRYPPTKAPDIKKYLPEIKKLILDGKGEEAAELSVQAGKEAGIEDLIWTDPLVPACQLEIKVNDESPVSAYAKTVNYENGEATVAWKSTKGIFHQKMFISRTDKVAVFKIYSPNGSKLNFKMRLAQLPLPEAGESNDEGESFSVNDLITNVKTSVSEKYMTYSTLYKKQWEGSLKGYNVTSGVSTQGGKIQAADGWLSVQEAEQIVIVSSIKLFYDLPVLEDPMEIDLNPDYVKLLSSHTAIHSEMFNRFSLDLDSKERSTLFANELLSSSAPGNLNTELVEQLCDASRYTLISSAGELPPTLQGIWGGTWLPAWSGDFTLNGNVPSAIACGLNANYQEVTEAYLNYMWSMFDDFKDNAHDLYGSDGIFVPSRSSAFGKTYHYSNYYCHLFWFAGAAWTSQFFYDYWLYTGNEQFLKERVLPFMLASAKFYEDILSEDDQGNYWIIPSYSPEIAPKGFHPAAINATMDVAALKQLLRNLIALAAEDWVDKDRISGWNKIIEKLPPYAVQDDGDLKEWIWPEYKNENSHRHASHLYPLFYEVDPDFETDEELRNAAIQAIENRLKYRRAKKGAEMAFGLVQKGLAAAHLGDTKHAYECVEWLCSSYWSPSFTSYHDPGEIFNVDIAGGLPAVVVDMIVQSSAKTIDLLSALPDQWKDGSIKGAWTRSGVTIDLKWKDGKPVNAFLKGNRATEISVRFNDKEWPVSLAENEIKSLKFDD
jgi:hypothetical protein